MKKEQENKKQSWVTVEWDYEWSGTNRAWWDKNYGKENWRLIWQLPNKESLDFDQLFALFVDSYAKYFEDNPVDALFLTNHFSYVYAYDFIYEKKEAFDPHALYDKQGKADQFYHAAINLSLVNTLGLEFKGSHPAGRGETKFWFPSQIPIERQDIIHPAIYPTLEDFYKKAQKLQIKK
ncbi:MAG: hypothetical protein UX01_C0001G0001 [Candidatus Collierbacteria bacterium GW2011_GWB2_45_17]|uniref:Uncharacterized protein n=1 Tax=Candidatus Collierbacteria bacterium GW2011_GWB2_45_17 TaxID=1618388 RepID=A0A837IFQ1_9BACT|nr:MAG: hypothetical protein UX01_C0001G0001 [Candidatus Collierbacteria bacterium GW2011_GWB2_45_17]HBC45304.1 hypothetical protein [Candidatus Collierbacteria bacterium]HCX25559.1 hypothetical protein [Candidatus Collierbacteria bacterium]